jgi:hypothetical protein
MCSPTARPRPASATASTACRSTWTPGPRNADTLSGVG